MSHQPHVPGDGTPAAWRETTAIDSTLLVPGFRHQVLDAQASFRAALGALSRPGTLATLDLELDPPAPLHAATAALALTLFDADTPVWLDPRSGVPGVQAFVRFHCGCPLVDTPERAAFAVVADAAALPSFDHFDSGSDQYPDQSCTLIVQLPALEGGELATLSGPGVNGEVRVQPRGLPAGFEQRWAVNHALFPRGLDLFLSSGAQLLGLPRTTAWSA